MEKYLKEADVPLVGCFANDTENRFTAGIDNNSEEIKKNKNSRSVTMNHSRSEIMFYISCAFLLCTLKQGHPSPTLISDWPIK